MELVSARELASLVVRSLGMDDVDPDQIDLDAPLFGEGLGLDSLDMLELSLAIQQRYGVKLKADDPQNEAIFSSLRSLAAHVGSCPAVRPGCTSWRRVPRQGGRRCGTSHRSALPARIVNTTSFHQPSVDGITIR